MAERRRIGLAALVALVAWVPAAPAGAQIGAQQVQQLDRQGATAIVVRREPGLSAAERADVRAAADVTLERRSTLPDTELVTADRGDLAEAVDALNDHPDVVYAEPVTVQTAQSADPYYPSLWGLENTGQRMYLPGSSSYYPAGTADADMDVPEAWTKATGAGVTVGIVDTGVLLTHPDLADQVAYNPGELGTDALARDKRANGVDDDGNGYVDDWRGWDFVREFPGIGVSEGDGTSGPDNDPQDNHGHGTHVAGTVAAQRDNGEGIAGVAPGAKVVALRALGANGRGSSIGIAEAFDYAGRLGLRVVNASLGGPGLDQSQLAAIQAHPNTLYVIAAGNDNVNVDATPYGPCALAAANVLCVGASDEHDRKAGFSNHGAANVDVFAPGTAILSTHTASPYAYLQGTSMASPNTAGVAALVLSARPGASALDIKSAIMASTEAKPDLHGRALTGGRVNADRAVTGALGGAPVSVTPPAISGTPRQGIALGASSGTWDPPGTTYAYAWQRSLDGGSSWTTIPGASGLTYTPGASDVNARIRVTVTATNPFGVASATSDHVGPVASGAPVNIVAPAIHGTPRRGHTLSVNASWSPTGTSYAYQWQRSADGVSWTTIGTSPTYALTTAERDTRVRVTITAVNAYGQTTATSDPVGPVVWDPPVNTAPPTVTGTPRRTFTLTAAPGSWDGGGNSYRYQWQRDAGGWQAIAGATAATYKLGKDDEGARVRVLVTASNADGTAERASGATELPVAPFPPANEAPPTISGTPQRSKTLSATRGDWTGPDNMYAFQWQRDFGEGYVNIDGATGASYTLTAGDVGTVVRVVVTATNPDATIAEASAPTTTVLPAGPVNLSPPLVSGSAQRGLTLNGTSGSWAGFGNSTSYRWQSSPDGASWTDIAGATTASYTLTVGDIGSRLRLLVTVTNPDGTVSAASAATAKVLSAPPSSIARPAVSGTARRGSVLTATTGGWSGNGNAYAYQWLRDGAEIAGATGSTYTLTAADVGAAVRVRVTAGNADGTASATSDPTATVAGIPPANTTRPVVSGIAQRGLALTSTPGTWSGLGNELSYQWQSSPDGTSWSDLAGATGATYAIAVADAGAFLRLLVTVTNPDGTASAASTPTARVTAAPPVSIAEPVISGTIRRGVTLTASTGAWSGNGNVYSYQWQRDGADIAGATSAAYELAAADVGATVRVIVTATNPDGTASAASSPTTTVPSAAPVNTVKPAITGLARRGSVLTAAAGTWTGIGNAHAFQWQRDGVDIAGATGPTYTLTVADVGAQVRVLVTTTNPEGSASRASDPTAAITGDGPVNTVAPAITGPAQRGGTLTASPGTWSGEGNTISYQWQRNGANITGATGPGYTLARADVGAAVRVLVTAINPDGSASRASAPTATVLAAPPVNTSAPVVTGAAVRTTTLSAVPGAWSGAGNTFAYQWQRDLGSGYSDVAGATGSTYLLGVADVGARIRVRVTATNPDGSAAASSIGSSVVQAGPPVSTSVPVISGTARRTFTLTASLGTWGGIGNEYAYQWQRDGANIPGATGMTYTLATADVGAVIRVRVTASNPDGTASATSAATAVVQAAPPSNGGAPAISGPARLGATLTASAGDWTPAGAAFAYRWQRDGADIPGATGATYTLTGADAGSRVRVRVTATNVDGSASAFSAATERVAAPPVNTVAPAAAGTPQETSVLTADPGGWDAPDATFSYSWWRCPQDATAISGCETAGSGRTHVLTLADVGHRLGVRVTASASGGETVAASALTEVVTRLPLTNLAPPSISGTAYVGETLDGDPGRWSFPAAGVVYDWRRCDGSACVSVGGGHPRYMLTAADVGHTIVLSVAAAASGQSATANSAPVTVRARPVPRSAGAPAITGTTKRTHTLRAGTGTWTNEPTRFDYQWLRCDGGGCHPIASATGDSYVLTRADVGLAVAVRVTAENAWGSGVAQAVPAGPVAAAPPVNVHVPVIQSPNPVIQQGLTLTVSGFAWDAPADTTYSLSWERCAAGACHAIAGATGSRYTLVAADVGHTIVAVSTASNVDATVPARSAETAVATIMAGPRWRTLPLITSDGNRVGDTVTITPGTWSGPVVTSDTVELMRCTNVCVARGAADASSYTIAGGDLGAILRVRETASNVGGESVVWSARYVGPVISAQAAAGVLSTRETPLRNAQGSTLALAKLSRAASAARARSSAKVRLRRPGKAKGKLTAWACEATPDADAAPICSGKVKVRRKATLRLPAQLAGKVRVVVVRG